MSNEMNVFAAPENGAAPAPTAAAAMMVSRQAQEVQAAMVVAKKFPRDNVDSANRILAACTRKTLAEAAIYEYPRGGETVTGPSIRLAEAIAQSWGNIDFGWIELEQRAKESQIMSYAWDLETNTRQTKIFTVPHIRYTKKGSYPLTDPRDIYEMCANQAARRVRSCILGIIPGDVVDMAMKQCNRTLLEAGGPLPDRIESMVNAFAEFQVTPEMLAGYIGRKTEAFSVGDVNKLGRIYRSLKDGVIGVEYFLDKMKEAAPANALPENKAPGIDAPKEEKQKEQPKQAPAEPESLTLDDI